MYLKKIIENNTNLSSILEIEKDHNSVMIYSKGIDGNMIELTTLLGEIIS